MKLNHMTMRTESCKTKDLGHNTGGTKKRVIHVKKSILLS